MMYAVKIVGGEVVDIYAAFVVVAERINLGGEYALHALDHIPKLKGLRGRFRLFLLRLVVVLYELFEIAYRKFVSHTAFCQLELGACIGDGDEAARMPFRKFACCNEVDNGRGEREQSERVGYGRARLSDTIGDFLLRIIVVIHQLPDSRRDLDGVEIFSLKVFDERDLLYLFFRVVADDGGHAFEPGFLCRAVTTFARDYHIIALAAFDEDDGSYDAVHSDTVCKLEKGCFIEMLAWLVFIGVDLIDGNFLGEILLVADKHAFALFEIYPSEQGTESPPESAFCHDIFLRYYILSPPARAGKLFFINYNRYRAQSQHILRKSGAIEDNECDPISEYQFGK